MKSISLKLKRKFIHLKPEIISLRKLGKSYSEIRKIYSIPKSTLSDWLKEIKMDPKIKTELETRTYEKLKEEAKKKMEKALKVRQTTENQSKMEIKEITNKELKLIGTALFWAEGSKRERQHLRFANSDPELIKVFLKFCRKVCKIPEEKIKARIHLYPGMDVQKAMKFWSEVTGIPPENFYKPQVQVSRASKRKRGKKLPFGTLHLVCGNTETFCKVKGWIQGICEKV
jgi:transposase-like protein